MNKEQPISYLKRIWRAKDNSIMMFAKPTKLSVNGKREWFLKKTGNYKQYNEYNQKSDKFISDNISWMAKTKIIIK